MWDASVLVGLPVTGAGSSWILAILLVLNLGIQAVFCGIVGYQRGFLGGRREAERIGRGVGSSAGV